MKFTLAAIAAVTGILTASPAPAELQKCVGPDGDVIFANTGCPDGYALEASAPASEPSPPDVQPPPSAPQAPPEGAPVSFPAPPEEPVGVTLTACAEGDFEYKEGGIFFTSTRRLACLGVKAVCTFSVSRSQRVVTRGGGAWDDLPRGDAYTTSSSREELNFNYTDKVGKFGTARIGDVTIKGKVTSWNCSVVN